MLQSEILFKRNLFVYHSLIIVNLLYTLATGFGFFKTFYVHYFTFSMSAILIAGILFLLRFSQKLIACMLLMSWNISAIILIIDSGMLINYFWLVFIFTLSLIYRKTTLTTVFGFILLFEGVVILKLKFSYTASYFFNSTITLIIFIIIVFALSIIQFVYILNIWHKNEMQSLNREWELSSKEGYLQMFFKNTDDAIAVFSLDNKIIEVNPAFEVLYGWTREESIGNWLPLVPPESIDASNERFTRVRKGERFKLIDTRDMRKDGTLIDVQITLSPIYNRQGDIIAASMISRDISYLKENEQLVMQSEKLKIVGEMAAGLAHEIRNPMTVISGFVQLMNADEHSPYKTYTELIQSEIERINLITSEFLVLSRPQKEHAELFNIHDVLDETLQLYSLNHEQNEIQVLKNFMDAPAIIEGNTHQIKQVFINLLKNATEAIHLNGTIQIKTSLKNEQLKISIKDDGCGIPAHVLERIFEPFYTTKTKGTGLGMMITKKIIEEHNGSIHVRSHEKIGTEIILMFPLYETGH